MSERMGWTPQDIAGITVMSSEIILASSTVFASTFWAVSVKNGRYAHFIDRYSTLTSSEYTKRKDGSKSYDTPLESLVASFYGKADGAGTSQRTT